jgi:hypothetical protein
MAGRPSPAEGDIFSSPGDTRYMLSGAESSEVCMTETEVCRELLADRDRMLEEIYQLRKFRAVAIGLIESMSRAMA